MQTTYFSRMMMGVGWGFSAATGAWACLDFLMGCVRHFFLGLAIGVPLVVHADTLYKCTDSSGKILFTNTRQPGEKTSCIILSRQRDPLGQTPPRRARERGSSAATMPTPEGFPRVSGDEQRARDSDRRAILEKELNSEFENLAKAQKLAATAGASPNTQVLRDTVMLHERNIKAIQKEIANLR